MFRIQCKNIKKCHYVRKNQYICIVILHCSNNITQRLSDYSEYNINIFLLKKDKTSSPFEVSDAL